MILGVAALATVVAVVVALVLASGSVTSKRPTSLAGAGDTTVAPGTTLVGSEAPVGWLAQDPTSVAFVQWFNNHGSINGTIQLSEIGGSGTEHALAGRTISFTGSISGTQVMLSPEGLAAWFGTLSGDVLTLNIPQSDGSLTPDSFHRASIADYNQIVGRLQGGAANQNGAAARAEQAAAQQKAYEDAVSSLSAAIDDLAHSVASLQGESPGSTLRSYANDWASMQKDYAKEQAEDCHYVQADAGYVDNDLGYIHNDDGYLHNFDGYVQNDESGVGQGISKVTAKLSLAQSAASVIGTSVDPTPANKAISAANAAVAAANQMDKDTHAKAATYEQEATQLDVTAHQFADAHKC